MELKNLELFKELDDLLMDLDEDVVESNEKLAEYMAKTNDIESGRVPESKYSELDDEEYLKDLISIAKGL